MKSLQDIKINYAYSHILGYNEDGTISHVNSNLAMYDIHPYYGPP
jgi:hypothetical protein